MSVVTKSKTYHENSIITYRMALLKIAKNMR